MANYRRGNVQYVDTTASFADIRDIESIKFIGDLGDVASVTPLKTDGTVDTGKVVWEQSGSQDTQGEPINVVDSEVCIRCSEGVAVTITGSAVVYLYLG